MSKESSPPPADARGIPTRAFASCLAALIPLATLVWALDLPRQVGLLLYPETFGGLVLALGLALVFIAVPAGQGRRRDRTPWYDLILALLGFVACSCLGLFFPDLSIAALRTPFGLGVSAVLVVLFLEGARRTAGVPIMLVAVGFLGVGLIAHMLPSPLTGRMVRPESLLWYLAWNNSGFLGTPTKVVVSVVIAFVLFGQALFLTGGAGFFTDLSMALMGRFRGGQAKIAIIASALFGTISGSTVANIVSTGVITIPMMKRAGYRPHIAGAVETVASTGGQLMPPVMGVAAFLIAEFLQISYGAVALAALVPSVIYFAALFIQVDLEAARRGIARVPAAEIPGLGGVLRAGWYIPVPFGILIACIFWLNVPLDLSALYATGAVLLSGVVFGYKGQRLTLARVSDVLTSTGRGTLDILMIAPLAGLVIGVLNVSGLSFTLAMSLVEMAGGNVVILLLLTGGVSILLGMGMPTVGVYILLATLVAPALVEAGIAPLAAHLFIFYYGMLSMVTPPVAIGAFAAASISGASPMRTGFAAMRFGWVAFVIPFLFVFSPSLLLQGTAAEAAVDAGTALAAVWFIAAGFTGYGLRRLEGLARVACALAGVGLFLPAGLTNWSIWANWAGGLLGAGLLGADYLKRAGQLPKKGAL
ncbi:TRAP transporter permease [Tritonibacter horizontis]|uniref:Sialic acid TRAP transporter permease protein SiaT n=1 Tax=Tritonibacter horizontis TaxID=1768241 RepID=A0A132BRW8_9RHOB|nr:TRAP transporter fused permease subunit [Tritonibacter horizontis]KUP90762.1 sialic acid TRAP transporter permease protein SiaT [Tritonibacter horizontis]